MSFLNKLGKDLGAAAEKARFEADKALKANRLGGELNGLNDQLQRATAGVGAKVMELHAAGQLNVPELDSLFTQVETLKQQAAAKHAEVEAVKASQFATAPAAAPAAAAPPAGAAPSRLTYGDTSAPATPAAPTAPTPPKFCPSCGTASEGANFCPSCGQKFA